ncbi:DUF1631 family protein [Ramlibacter sp. H39-3-26]|uniref:DUF1631 family protein n=1 Tax=Curvibacter soli TaxID=3031331 RepID=UPI0023D9F336|nr:DUF1631 family protein [Ramlibacter sp. H39-3-26]MDF1484454.1 DUF1631 family protein [Ramlibacter sp. H39-3-26]
MSRSPEILRYQAVYRDCIAQAARDGGPLMQRLARSALQALQPQDSAVHGGNLQVRNTMSDAHRLLAQHERALVENYPATLRAVFIEGGPASRAKPGGASALSFDQLELMDESEVQDKVELARAQQIALHAAESPLAELNTYICAAQGLRNVQPERNPLRPESYIRALQDAITQTNVSSAVRLAWMQAMCDVLGKELVGIYEGICTFLQQQGIAPVGYAVAPSHADTLAVARGGGAAAMAAMLQQPQPQPHAGAQQQSAGAAPAGEGDEALLTVGRLRQLLSGELDMGGGLRPMGLAGAAAAPAAVGRPDFQHTVPAAFDMIEDMRQIEQVVERLAQRQPVAPPPLTALHRAAGIPAPAAGAAARGAGQSVGVEVVSLMIENIAQDARLLPPVQKAVQDLEPALIQLVLADPRFFSDKDHPARRLLDEMTQRSLAFDTTSAPGFPEFMRVMRTSVDHLATSVVVDAAPFEQELESLQKVWDAQSDAERAHREKAVQALLQAEQRNLLAEKIAGDIQEWPDAGNVPAPIMAFVIGPWVQVVAQARLGDRAGAADPGGYLGLVPNLFWSAQPVLARNNLPRLTKLIPGLLAKLREGLKTIDYPPMQASAFFEHLIGLHQQAFQSPSAPAATAPIAAPAATISATLPAPPATESSGPWLAPNEVLQAGLVEDEPPPVAEPVPAPAAEAAQAVPPPQAPSVVPVAEPETAAPAATAPATLPTLSLEVGAWVELLTHGRVVRTQLTWASPHGTLFLFTGADGSTQSMTKRMRDKLATEGALRVVSRQTVVEGALDAVAQTAMRNTLGR